MKEKEFWNELDWMIESIPRGERVALGAEGHVGEGNRGDKEVTGRFGVKNRNLKGFYKENGDGCGKHLFPKERTTE